MVANNIQLYGNITIPFSFSWHVPRGIASGLYRINVYAISADQFAVSGAEWSDSSANTGVDFQVTGDAKEVSYLNTSSLRVDGMRLFNNRFVITSGRVATGTMDILNNFSKTHTVSVIWKVYSSEIISEANLVSYNNAKKINLIPGQRTVYSFVVPTVSDPLSHIVLELTDGEKKSIYSFRILEKNATHSTITALGLSDFPLVAGKEAGVFGCVSSSVVTKNNSSKTLRLSIIRTVGGANVANFGSTTVNGLLSSFSRKFILSTSLKVPIILKAELINKLSGKVESTATLSYSCDKFSCPDTSFWDFFNQFGVKGYYTSLILGISAIAAILVLMNRKKKKNLTTMQ